MADREPGVRRAAPALQGESRDAGVKRRQVLRHPVPDLFLMEEPLRKLNRCGSRNLGILKPEAGEELLQGIKRRIITLQKIADGEPRLTQIPQNLFRVLIGKPGNFCLFPIAAEYRGFGA